MGSVEGVGRMALGDRVKSKAPTSLTWEGLPVGFYSYLLTLEKRQPHTRPLPHPASHGCSRQVQQHGSGTLGTGSVV